LEELVERKAALPRDPNLQQTRLFGQYSRVIRRAARQNPLMLILDDLQWMDTGSVSLLFHLGLDLAQAGYPMLIIGAYRPQEVALGRAGERHSLENVLTEFKRRFGDVWVDLACTEAAEARRFVDALLDREPNRLDEGFRDSLFRHTEGHPLFTTELIRALQERGDLFRDTSTDVEGVWVQVPKLDWRMLPPRVEGVIEERIKRLEDEQREILKAASVEGEEFTAQVIARVQAVDERWVIRQLGSVLEKQHGLVSAEGIRRIDGLRLSLHRFRHNLFQKYVYNNLNEAERTYLHEDVGGALEALYADYPQELPTISPQLARHFEEAGITEKAIYYLRQAGERATRMSASEEAVDHFSRALSLLETLHDSPERAQTELTLQLGLAVPLIPTKGWAAPEMARVIARARELCEQVGETPQRFGALWFTYTYYGVRGQFQMAREYAEQVRDLAEAFQDQGLILVAHYGLAAILLFMAEVDTALIHAEHGIDVYDPKQHHILASLIVGHDPGAQCLETAAWALWALGYPDQARLRMQEALSLAEELSHPYTSAWAHHFESVLQSCVRDWHAVLESAEVVRGISNEWTYPITEAYSACARGLALAKTGQAEEGIAQLRRGISDLLAAEVRIGISSQYTWLADAHFEAGQMDEGLRTVEEGLAYVAVSQERYREAELHRLKGELLRQQGEATAAEAGFQHAIEVAHQHGTKSWELRATMSLARLWRAQGKQEKARRRLEKVYAWFTEGFDTADLKDAQVLLDELSKG
jgi:adenylate cyclase